MTDGRFFYIITIAPKPHRGRFRFASYFSVSERTEQREQRQSSLCLCRVVTDENNKLTEEKRTKNGQSVVLDFSVVLDLQSSVVLDLQSNTIYYQDLQSANIFVVNDFHLMWNERLVKTDSKF